MVGDQCAVNLELPQIALLQRLDYQHAVRMSGSDMTSTFHRLFRLGITASNPMPLKFSSPLFSLFCPNLRNLWMNKS